MINIACNIDSRYESQCCVMLTSLFENNKEEVFHIYVLYMELSDEAQSSIRKLVEDKYSQKVTFLSISKDKLSAFKIFGASHISIATYIRLFVAQLLPDSVNKLLYLDCDLIVNDSISELWNIDISNYSVGCVEDMWSGNADNYQRLEYSDSDTYFNAGVLLINLEYWRKENVLDKCLSFISAHSDVLIFNDQDVLNGVLHESKLLVPFRWNIQDGFLRRKRKIRTAAVAELDKELQHPVIIHYTGNKKPWMYNCLNPYKELYYKYLDMTHWKGIRPKAPFIYNFQKVSLKLQLAFHLKNGYRKVDLNALR